MGLEPAMDGPPVWMVTVMPCFLAHLTIGAASLPVRTEPSPISPTRLDPGPRHLGEVLLDHAQLEDGRARVHLDAGRDARSRRPWPPRSPAP